MRRCLQIASFAQRQRVVLYGTSVLHALVWTRCRQITRLSLRMTCKLYTLEPMHSIITTALLYIAELTDALQSIRTVCHRSHFRKRLTASANASSEHFEHCFDGKISVYKLIQLTVLNSNSVSVKVRGCCLNLHN